MSNAQIETVASGADKAKLAAAGLLVVGGVAAFYLLGKQDLWLRIIALLVLMAAAVGVFLTSVQGKELVAFGQDSVKELRKVVWPARQETLQITLIVLVLVFLIGLFLWLVDSLLFWGVQMITGQGA